MKDTINSDMLEYICESYCNNHFVVLVKTNLLISVETAHVAFALHSLNITV